MLTEPQLIDGIMRPQNIGSARLLQIVTSIGAFIFPGWLFTKVAGFDFATRKKEQLLIFISLVLPIVALPVVDWLATLNGLLTFPIESIDDWMKMKELQAIAIYEDFLYMKGPTDLAINLLMMAVVPAVGEELLFRAGLQQYLGKITKNGHLAIWITAFLFSAIHFQFYTFIPRFIMGAGLGYLFYWGGNITYPIIAHFINNATAVVMTYLSCRVIPEDTFENIGSEVSIWVVGSIIGLAILYFGFQKMSLEKDPLSSTE